MLRKSKEGGREGGRDKTSQLALYSPSPINTCGVQKLPGLSISLWDFIGRI